MPLLATAALVVILSGLLGSSGTPRASGALGAEGEPVAQGDVSVPARSVVMLGSSPADPSLPADEYETWGIGELGSTDASAIVRYTRAGGWSLTPAITAGGAVLSGFKPAPSPLTGETTQAGSGVLVGTNGKHDIVLVRSPGEPFKETEVVPPELLKPEGQPEQSLYATHRAPLLAALDEGAEAGALVVPVSGGSSGFENGVLHWEGAARKWTREAIEVPGSPQEGMRVLAIGASSPSNAWLLAQLSSSSSGVSLFRRRPAVGGKPASWQPVVVAPGGEPGEALTVPTVEREGAHGPRTVPFAVPGAPDQVEAQILTVTAEGVWIDGER
ncbi:MAG TPA: hypothetical protein VKG62_02285, partial [Solirubrobacteraceae bacterium]|nr:hypothetical protein [Solirubrobacteraceae bacterium]